MSAPEDRITDALRAGRISRFRAWWERRHCPHAPSDRGPIQDRQIKDEIDTWQILVYRCNRCGCLMRVMFSELDLVLERPKVLTAESA